MDEDEAVPPPPAGFTLTRNRGPFGAHNGPSFHRDDGGPAQQAFYVLRRHTNKLGLAHGGMLTTFMDIVLADASLRETGRRGVTVHLTMDFLRMVRAGDWVIGEAHVSRASRDLCFVDGRAWVDGVDVVRASGIFKLMHGPRER